MSCRGDGSDNGLVDALGINVYVGREAYLNFVLKFCPISFVVLFQDLVASLVRKKILGCLQS